MRIDMIDLLEVNPFQKTHIKFLYELLKKKEFNISHEKLPSFEEHKTFVENNPYRKWYFLLRQKQIMGSIYITNENIIGINIPKAQTDEYFNSIKLILNKMNPLKPIKSVRSKNFCINVNPNNNGLIKALKMLDMELIEQTYRVKE